MDDVFLTGATGFVGSHVLRSLLDSGYRVRALVRPGALPLPTHDNCVSVTGDVRRSGELVRALDGCRYLVHVAAHYSFSPRDRAALQATNVAGTAGILEAARIAGVERVVVTSSSATVGPACDGRPATEQDWAQDGHRASAYHASKLAQERAALAAQVPVVLVLPTAPVGPGDARPTPTGKMIVDFMRGRMVAALPGGLNVVPVEDVARGHVLAMERGCIGERYLLGGENLRLGELWQRLGEVCNRRVAARQVPFAAALAAGWVDEMRCRLWPHAQPIAPLEGVWMGRETMFVNDAKARSELGYASTSIQDALARAVDWYRVHGYA